MWMLRWITFIVFMLLPATVSGESAINYVDKVFHYSVEVPASWKPMNPQVASSRRLITGFSAPGLWDFQPCMTIQIHTCPSLEAFDEKCRRDVEEQGTLVSQKDTKLGKIAGRQLVWQCQRKGRDLQYLSTYFVIEGKSYVLNAVCLQSDWKKLAPVFARSAASLRSLL